MKVIRQQKKGGCLPNYERQNPMPIIKSGKFNYRHKTVKKVQDCYLLIDNKR